MGPIRKSSEWEEICNIKVIDPDGWDRTNFTESWGELITRSTFERRAMESTSMPLDIYIQQWGGTA